MRGLAYFSLLKGNRNETKKSSSTHDNIWCQFICRAAWCSVFVCVRVRQVKPEHRKKNRGVKVSPCTNLKPQKHTHTCAVWSLSVMSRFYEHICPHIQSTFQNLDKCLSAFPLSTRSPPLFFVPSPVHLPHLHPLCPLLLYLPLFCSSTCPRIVHLSDPVTWEADSQHTHRPLYHPLICAVRPNSPHSEPPDTMR